MNTELEVLDPQIHQTTQIAMNERRLSNDAPQPAVTAHPRASDFTPHAGTYAFEWPVRFIPRVEIIVGAIDNATNVVVKTVKEYENEGETFSLIRPLSTAKNGIAVKPLTELYEMLRDMNSTQYIFLAADDEQINTRANALLKQIQSQLVASFNGDPFETVGQDYAISRNDLYRTSVAISNKVSQTAGHKTVNDVELVVSVYVHAAGLTSSAASVKDVELSYAKVVKNLTRATGIETSLNIAFDVSNFKERQSILALFSALCVDSITTNVEAVVNATHIPASANILVGVDLNKQTVK